MGVAGWLTLTLAGVTFLVVGTTGLFLILRVEPGPHAPHNRNGTNPRNDCGETRERCSRRPVEHSEPTRVHRALQPPRRR
jgi:hypothetical protein